MTTVNLFRLGVLTSGGDAPGMNAAIRAITLKGLSAGFEIVGINAGYNGIFNLDTQILSAQSVDNIIQRGGTLLKTARCSQLREEDGPRLAAEKLTQLKLDALIIIGGDGSFRGAVKLAEFWPKPIIGIPGTIDNDINGTDQTIGFWTAIDTALDSIDKIRDTADAFERIFVVEVMGRDCGFIAMESGIACGAEQIICHELIEDEETYLAQLYNAILHAVTWRQTQSYVIVIAEHSLSISSAELAKRIADFTGVDTKSAILGYIQRGGAPVAMDRVLATQLGISAVKAVCEGKTGLMIGMKNNEMVEIPFAQTGLKNTHNQDLIKRLKHFNFDLTD
ncbi:ATP-dependent 6-phosphofructokinase [Pseudoalteromonas tunicata]|uniref:ATP-dependent 6-phosphofructokinase n=1 Tax=Pseudoalteromonas tunicata TaxID=314281 RepID=UPI00273ECD78|nr:ATP-dependent 6-phosphofructokinase [Pseudoalteromonas tunicata]MDP4982280.1 6-phosphofructokinase [Pseudoalteromonas tunicata]